MFKKKLPIVFVASVAVLLFPFSAQACPSCANSLSNALGGAFNLSVLFMMAMPFTVFGAFVAGFILLNRHAQKNSSRLKTVLSQSEPSKEARS